MTVYIYKVKIRLKLDMPCVYLFLVLHFGTIFFLVICVQRSMYL